MRATLRPEIASGFRPRRATGDRLSRRPSSARPRRRSTKNPAAPSRAGAAGGHKECPAAAGAPVVSAAAWPESRKKRKKARRPAGGQTAGLWRCFHNFAGGHACSGTSTHRGAGSNGITLRIRLRATSQRSQSTTGSVGPWCRSGNARWPYWRSSPAGRCRIP